MLKTIIKSTLAVTALFSFAQTVNAAHSTYSPMAPRQLSVKASHAYYSYGLSILPGNSIDSIEVLNRNVFWRGNYLVFDRYLLRPVAHAYAKLPNFIKVIPCSFAYDAKLELLFACISSTLSGHDFGTFVAYADVIFFILLHP